MTVVFVSGSALARVRFLLFISCPIVREGALLRPLAVCSSYTCGGFRALPHDVSDQSALWVVLKVPWQLLLDTQLESSESVL